MSYIVVAKFDPEAEINSRKWRSILLEKSYIHLLSERDGEVSVDMRGDFLEAAAITRTFCSTLIDAGILEFSIRHGY